VRSAIAAVLWVACALLVAFFVFSGWWIFGPFAFASGAGEQILLLIVAILVLGSAAYLVGHGQAT
jgi:hypothetical protein